MRYVDGSVVEAVMNNGEDAPETLPDPRTGEPAFRVFWQESSAWRGHYDTEPLNGDWIRLEEGTVCGEWDDVPEGTRSSEVEARLDALAETRDILIVILPTSNVFAMAYDCYGLVEQS